MIEITTNQQKNITFESSINGISPQELDGYFRITVDGIEYGFKAKITENTIEVSIPSLKNIIHRTLKESETFQSKLEMYGSGYYLNPWQGEVKIKSSVMIEAKILDEKNINKSKPSVSIKENKLKQQKIVKEALKKKKNNVVITKEHLYKFMEKKGTKDKKIQDVILETCITKVGDSDLRKLFKEVYNYYNVKNKA